ncbi:uncharacterized protein VTP21DRAFT_4416 [Calcarisporiella thermophila]|uniref:uncharacterized protein n=1 Tax=Calcarisporiella thermophila TaxID=911321 RepID=UPI003743713A
MDTPFRNLQPFEPYWGKVTSTIDWCEENYTVLFWIAEFFNTVTNAFFVILSLVGIYVNIRNKLGFRFTLSNVGLLLIGIGSWWFHMTLQYEFQLLDELPMIYGALILVYNIFEMNTRPRYGLFLPALLALYGIVVTAVYIKIRNPVFHQVAYAILVGILVVRSVALLRRIEDKKRKGELSFLLQMAVMTFGGGFVLWNIDNQFCNGLRNIRWRYLPFPFSGLAELHGWWHILTCLGTHFYLIANQYLYCIYIGRGDEFDLKYYFGLPFVIRSTQVEKKNKKKRL